MTVISQALRLKMLLASSVIGAAVIGSGAVAESASANEPTDASIASNVDLQTLTQYGHEGRGRAGTPGLNQVTSVSQLSDVSPTDWAFQALQSLVERYGCIAGYPNGTYRGNRAMTRYEFAAGLNACLERVNELIAAATSPLASKADLQVLQRLQEEFSAELAEIRGRVDSLEARTTELEANQFSTTTKLEGSVIFSIHAGGIDDDNGDELSDQEEVAFGQRTRLLFNTSFTGDDLLTTRLEDNNIQSPFADANGLGALSYGDGDSNVFELSFLGYSFPINDQLEAIIGPVGIDIDDVHPVHSGPLYGDGSGAITVFADRNPVLRQPADAGFGLSWSPSDNFSFHAAYHAGEPASPSEGEGLFNGSYSASASINYYSSDSRFSAGLFYANSYQSRVGNDLALLGGTGTANVSDPFDGESIESDNIAFQTNFTFNPKFGINGWFGYTNARSANDSDDEVDLITWAVALNFYDLFSEGSYGAILVGQPPTVTDADGADDDDFTPIHVEALYRYALNDFISITPGVAAIFNADEDGDTAILGVLRTEFAF
ncbi:MAG: iron uptake porin [Cyanobacteria bacterium P01_F01_bin.153]